MAERKTLGDAMTPVQRAFISGSNGKQSKSSRVEERPQAPAKTIELSEPAASDEAEARPSRRRSRGRSTSDEPLASEVLDQVLVPVTIRLPHRTAQALKRAHLEQKLKYSKPDTLQGINEEALADWLTKAGYLD